jgi:hypothetical protein
LYKQRKRESMPLYKILTSIEEIADEYKYLYRYFASQPSIINKDILKTIETINVLLEKLFSLMFSFEIPKLKKVYEQHDKGVLAIQEYYKKAKQEELQILHYLRNISRLIHEMDSSIISWKIDHIATKSA